MKYWLLILCILLSASCQDDSARAAENERAAKKREAVFSSINNSWQFDTRPAGAASQTLVAEWAEWRAFVTEISQKPQSTIGAFRKKARTLSVRASALRNNIPARFDKPEVRSRIGVLITKINALNLYINLPDIPEAKVRQLITDVNREIASLQRQFEEVVRRSSIPKEIGEEEMLRMLDTSRAIPTVE